MLCVKQTVGNKGRNEDTSLKDFSIIQGRDNDGLNQDSSDEDREK